MLDIAIQKFFKERTESFLAKEIKSSMGEDEIKAVKEKGKKKFSPEYWLPDAAKRAQQISISTHPCTFSHPSARKNKGGYVTSVIAKGKRQPDGYLRTGNLSVEQDALGNAAALDVYKFLTLTLEDGTSLIEHIERDSELAKALLTISTESYLNLKKGLLSMIDQQESQPITSSKIKQVYFPIDDENYHLLSVLANSGLIFELRKRIDELRFSEKQKDLRDLKRKNGFNKEGFSEIYHITTVGYGGTKPQNISVLNNKYGGKTRLLLSAPPQLFKREIQFPRQNFFKHSIRYHDVLEQLNTLHGIFNLNLDSPIPRRHLESSRNHNIEAIVEQVIERMISIRAIAADQFHEKTSKLPWHQKIWLCEEYLKERAEQHEWLDILCDEISQWIVAAYRKVIYKPVVLGEEETRFIKDIIQTHKEVLR